MRLISMHWWSSRWRITWSERMRGFIRSSSVSSSAARMAAPACRTSAWLSECTSSMPKWRSTICMPGVTFVDFSAMSVTRLISMPGEISTNRLAWPSLGRKPCATVAWNEANCGCRLSSTQ